MKKSFNTTFGTALYCVLSATTVGVFSVHAEAADLSVSTKVVRYDDLNVSSAAGARALYLRIRAAAHDVCRSPAETGPFAAIHEEACMNKAVDNAVRDVRAPELTALRFGTETRLARR